MTSAERTATLTQLGKRVATVLNLAHFLGWEFVEPTEDTYQVYMLNRYTGARVYLGLSASKGYEVLDRVNVTGWFHVGKNGSFVEVRDNNVRVYPEISIALSRGAEAIAKDIAKRFLPQYLPAFERACEIALNERRYEQRITDTLASVAITAGIPVPKPGQYNTELRREAHGSIGNVGISIYAYEEAVDLKLGDLTLVQAQAVIGYIKTLVKP